MTKAPAWHAPMPGPGLWDWRCLWCSEPVADHPGFLRRLWVWWMNHGD